eukprot:SAG11_NODE_5671_length_1490_cov_1.421280_1_plen_263_part_00
MGLTAADQMSISKAYQANMATVYAEILKRGMFSWQQQVGMRLLLVVVVVVVVVVLAAGACLLLLLLLLLLAAAAAAAAAACCCCGTGSVSGSPSSPACRSPVGSWPQWNGQSSPTAKNGCCTQPLVHKVRLPPAHPLPLPTPFACCACCSRSCMGRSTGSAAARHETQKRGHALRRRRRNLSRCPAPAPAGQHLRTHSAQALRRQLAGPPRQLASPRGHAPSSFPALPAAQAAIDSTASNRCSERRWPPLRGGANADRPRRG